VRVHNQYFLDVLASVTAPAGYGNGIGFETKSDWLGPWELQTILEDLLAFLTPEPFPLPLPLAFQIDLDDMPSASNGRSFRRQENVTFG
jgi:hypothetical protein